MTFGVNRTFYPAPSVEYWCNRRQVSFAKYLACAMLHLVIARDLWPLLFLVGLTPRRERLARLIGKRRK